MEFFKTVTEEMHPDNSLLQTIKIPKNLLFLTDRLPQANYEKVSKKGNNFGSSEITIKKKKGNNSSNIEVISKENKESKENVNIVNNSSSKVKNSNNSNENNKSEEKKNPEEENHNSHSNNHNNNHINIVKKSNRDRSAEHSNSVAVNNNRNIVHNNMSQSPPAHGKINYNIKDNKYNLYKEKKQSINKIYNINAPNSESQEVLPNINRGGGYMYNDPRM